MAKRISPKEIDWSYVKAYFEERTQGGYAMSLIEAEKLFRLAAMEYLGKGTFEETDLLFMSPALSAPEELLRARKESIQLIHDPQVTIRSDNAAQALRSYSLAIQELLQSDQLTRTQRISLRAKKRLQTFRPSIPRVTIGLFLSLLLVEFLSQTHIGNSLAMLTAHAATFLLTWTVIISLLIVGIGVALFGTLSYLERRKKSGNPIELE